MILEALMIVAEVAVATGGAGPVGVEEIAAVDGLRHTDSATSSKHAGKLPGRLHIREDVDAAEHFECW